LGAFWSQNWVLSIRWNWLNSRLGSVSEHVLILRIFSVSFIRLLQESVSVLKAFTEFAELDLSVSIDLDDGCCRVIMSACMSSICSASLYSIFGRQTFRLSCCFHLIQSFLKQESAKGVEFKPFWFNLQCLHFTM
jgi:hypothetical protein